jgi:hypothetical protein
MYARGLRLGIFESSDSIYSSMRVDESREERTRDPSGVPIQNPHTAEMERSLDDQHDEVYFGSLGHMHRHTRASSDTPHSMMPRPLRNWSECLQGYSHEPEWYHRICMMAYPISLYDHRDPVRVLGKYLEKRIGVAPWPLSSHPSIRKWKNQKITLSSVRVQYHTRLTHPLVGRVRSALRYVRRMWDDREKWSHEVVGRYSIWWSRDQRAYVRWGDER